MVFGYIIYGLIALLIIVTAAGMLISRNTVYSALFLVLNFTLVAILYFTLGAPFIALTQISVYAGAIMILFLFVIMLLGSEKMDWQEPLKNQRLVAGLLAFFVLLPAAVLLISQTGALPPLTTPDPEFGSPATIGNILFTQYTLPFLVIGFLLLVATIGAIILTKTDTPRQRIEAMESKKD